MLEISHDKVSVIPPGAVLGGLSDYIKPVVPLLESLVRVSREKLQF